jgi:hypothetical protein
MRLRTPVLCLTLLALAPTVRAAAAPRAPDPLAAEVARWETFLRVHVAAGPTDTLWPDIKQGSEPALQRTQQALRDRRRLLALLRLSVAREGLAAAAYMSQRAPAERTDTARFEAEWARMGAVLRRDLAPPAAAAFDGLRPALVRALAEAALPQVKVYYEASLDYGRSTTPESGLYYLGSAQAAREFVAFLRTLPAGAGRAPALRGLGAELEALEGEMLSVYRPPLSIDRHREFIGAHSALKEARELDALGLHHGALLRYLQAALRFAPLRTPAPAVPADLRARLDRLAAPLERGRADHTIARLFLEVAAADLAEHAQDGAAANAAAVAAEVLPRYLAALEPFRPPALRPQPQVTITLVRWPYT